jgi:hypothetical protein
MQLKFGTVTTEPITSAEVKTYCKIDYSDEDSLIQALIAGVRDEVEQFTGLGLVARTIEYFDEEIADEIKLPFPDHASITEVKFNGVVSTAYTKTGLSQFIIYPNEVTVSEGNDKGIYVKYVTSGVCPAGIKLEMLKIIDEKYRNRGNTFEGAIAQLNENAYANLAKYCLM